GGRSDNISAALGIHRDTPTLVVRYAAQVGHVNQVRSRRVELKHERVHETAVGRIRQACAREIGRGGGAGEVRATRAIERNSKGLVVAGAAQIAREQLRRAVGPELGHENVVEPAGKIRL